ncbi:unnamed protein product, partial [Brassica rapa subsp. narinosa]
KLSVLWARFVFLNIQSRPEGRQVTTWDFVPSGSLLGGEDEIVTGRLLFRVQTGEIDFAPRLRDYEPIHTEYDTNTNTKLKQKLSIRVSATEIQQQLKSTEGSNKRKHECTLISGLESRLFFLSVTEKIEDQKLRDTRIVILLMRRGQFGYELLDVSYVRSE